MTDIDRRSLLLGAAGALIAASAPFAAAAVVDAPLVCGDGLVRFVDTEPPADAKARYAIEMRPTSTSAWVFAGLYLDVGIDGGLTRVTTVAAEIEV